MTDVKKPDDMTVTELLAQSDIRDSATGRFVEECDCAECREFVARLRSEAAARKLSDECKTMYITEDWRHLAALAYDSVMDAARKESGK